MPRADKAVALAPQNVEARLVRGQANFDLQRFDAAAEDAKAALSLDPRNRLAQALLKLSEGREAAVNPGRAPAGARPLNAGNDHWHMTRSNPYPDQAAAQATVQQLKSDKYTAEASSKFLLGDSIAAQTLLDKALALDPKNAKALAMRSKTKLILKDPPGALQDAEAAVEANPKNAEAYLNRAKARLAMGQPVRLILDDYNAAAELNPEFNDEYQAALARYQGGNKAGDIAAATPQGQTSWHENALAGFPKPLRIAIPTGILMAAIGVIWLVVVWLKKQE